MVCLYVAMLSACSTEPQTQPNIVYILADDLGYGDVSCLNPDAKVSTPNLDQLAAEGIRFTDAHSGLAVCTPTRYGILTGRYCWRSKLKHSVLWAWDPPLIEKDRLTVGDFLKQQGYSTACIGKWHLGWDWATTDSGEIDFTADIQNGPTTRGFDYYFGDDVPNFPPYCFIENNSNYGNSIYPQTRFDLWECGHDARKLESGKSDARDYGKGSCIHSRSKPKI